MKVEILRSRGELKALGQWLPDAARRFGVSGYGKGMDAAPSVESLGQKVDSALYAGIVRGEEPGLVIVERSPWEESVVGRPFARIAFVGADTYEGALALLQAATNAMLDQGVVLARATSGTAPGHIQVAYGIAGFYVGSQLMTLSADLEELWAKLARVPECRNCRFSTPADADALVRVADGAFSESRFFTDPYFNKEWGNQLYAAWTRKIATGSEHRLIVVEKDGAIIGFANVQTDTTKMPEVPGLFVVTKEAQGSGLGALLLRSVIKAYRDAGSSYPLITTEKGNHGVNSLFSRLGYRIENVNVIYHWTPRVIPSAPPVIPSDARDLHVKQ